MHIDPETIQVLTATLEGMYQGSEGALTPAGRTATRGIRMIQAIDDVLETFEGYKSIAALLTGLLLAGAYPQIAATMFDEADSEGIFQGRLTELVAAIVNVWERES